MVKIILKRIAMKGKKSKHDYGVYVCSFAARKE